MERTAGRANAGWWWLVALVLAQAVQLWAFYSPAVPGPGLFPHSDKVFHAGSFALVGFFGVRTLSFFAGSSRWRPLTGASVLAGILVLHAIASELIQANLLPTRSGDVLDVVADVAGVALGIGLALSISGPGSLRARNRWAGPTD